MKTIHYCKNPNCKNYETQLVDDLDHDDDCFWCSECGKTSGMIRIEDHEAGVYKTLLEDAILSRKYWKKEAERLEMQLENIQTMIDNL